MTSLVHFEKVAKAIETPHLAAVDGGTPPSIAGDSFGNGGEACDTTMPFGDFEPRDRSVHALYKYADLKSASITIR
jgi:gamma-glutamyl-gamma-aminobutyraldehyde dehydrogenase